MTWMYNGEGVSEEMTYPYIGFVYLITNKADGRRYIGKKLFSQAKTRTVKGKKKRSRIKSDWETYYGSNKELQGDVKKLGAEMFDREILRMCTSKGECSYFEAKYQFDYNVLTEAGWYNTWICCRVRRDHIKI